MRILLWHVHGSYTTALVQGRHEYFVPVTPDRGPDGLGRARTWDWPASVREVPLDRIAETEPDVVILQRPHEEELVRPLGRVPTVYLEHDAPWGDVPLSRHPLADRPDLRLVHVTHFNDLFWDCGTTPTTVVEHGVVDPGPLWTGEVPRAAVVVNEPVRRGRYVGTDLLPRLDAPLDVFGMKVSGLTGCRTYEDLPQDRMHAELARRRVYVHPIRWTSLGLSLLEAMHLGMPVVALATTEVVEAVPSSAGTISTDVDVLRAAIRRYLADPGEAAEAGRAARESVLGRYGLQRFLDDWDRVLKEVTA
ncbi:glycosyltransferase [Actinoallomurus iriomotensis]|uniref:Glycosyl transferase n=1 Tax=Actinoallomurus iriomotensis TaxID=478107 RepID=A0A9W6RQM3_9ACTN|nr:glycosyltransferase [Actinoallomurus iriomotensis]GLY80711.1 glycosyl transferase [Actinoallomurus iriomotensis]